MVVPSSRFPALVAFVSLVLAAGCSDSGSSSSSPTTVRPTGDAVAVCDGLRQVSELDQHTKQLVTEAPDWPSLQNLLANDVSAAIAGYDKAKAESPPEIAADITALRDLTVESATAARESNSIDEWLGKITSLPDTDAAAAAGERLNNYAVKTCGFKVSGNT